MAGTLAYLRALLCRDGPDEMRRDAQAALAGLGPLSPYRAAMLHAVGAADLLEGDLEQADLNFARALDEATECRPVPFIPVVLAERGIVAVARDDWSRGRGAVGTGAWRSCDDGRYDDYWTSALVYAFAASVAARAAIWRRLATWRDGRLGCGRCSPTPSRSCRCRRCSNWPAPT